MQSLFFNIIFMTFNAAELEQQKKFLKNTRKLRKFEVCNSLTFWYLHFIFLFILYNFKSVVLSTEYLRLVFCYDNSKKD